MNEASLALENFVSCRFLSAVVTEMSWAGMTAVVMASVVSVVPRQARAATTSNKAHAAVTKLAAVLPV